MKWPFIIPLACILACVTCCGKTKLKGNAEREDFMQVLMLLGDMQEYDHLLANQSPEERNVTALVAKCDQVLSAVKEVDAKFLGWVEPGLPDAFNELQSWVQMHSEGLATNSMDLQLQAEPHRLKWVAYWRRHRLDVFRKLKVK